MLLDKAQLEVLRYISAHDGCSYRDIERDLGQGSGELLLTLDKSPELIRFEPSDEDWKSAPIHIVPKAAALLENAAVKKKNETKETVRYWITTTIAVLALLLALLSLMWQYEDRVKASKQLSTSSQYIEGPTTEADCSPSSSKAFS